MADWLDRRLGGFCKAIQDQIDELPLLSPAQKQTFLDILDDCAKRADESEEDSIAFMRRESTELRNQVKLKAGRNLYIG